MHINWEKPNFNQQDHHVNLTLKYVINFCQLIIINYACFA